MAFRPPEYQAQFYISAEGISREVITTDICRYLGTNARIIRPNMDTNVYILPDHLIAFLSGLLTPVPGKDHRVLVSGIPDFYRCGEPSICRMNFRIKSLTLKKIGDGTVVTRGLCQMAERK